MDLVSLGYRILTSIPSGTNGTNSTVDFTDLPIKILEAVIPGYSLFNNVTQQYLGFDVSLVMTIFAFFYIAQAVVSYVWDRAYYTFIRHFTSSVHINGNDDLYVSLMQWIAATRPDLSKRSLTARTSFGGMNMDDDGGEDKQDKDAALLAAVAVNSDGFLNFSTWAARVPPRYEPDFGSFWFVSSSGIFQFSKTEHLMRASEYQERVELQVDLRCIGLTTTPIKNLLTEIRDWAVTKQSTKTVIKVPEPFYYNGWFRASERPSRPMDTVILDPVQKNKILRDMNEYLHPMSAKWYATRGIPYRRGYLFHGPPGTGKTSLSFALAGIFGLDIHIVNLMDPDLTEIHLSRLFNELPKRCIVLFEDIDAAGMEKRDDVVDADSGGEGEKEIEEEKKSAKKSEKSKAKQKRDSVRDQPKTNGVKKDTLSLALSDGGLPATTDDQEKVVGEDTNTSLTTTISDNASTASYSPSLSSPSTPPLSTPDPDIPESIHQLARAIVSLQSKPQPESDSKSDSESDFPPLPALPRPPRHCKIYRTSPGYSARNNNQSECNISLSGLLNAIDGIATHEGRILIMTTNYPQKLDSALLRPGRIDLQVSFTAATKLQAKELFLRMFAADGTTGSKDKTVGNDELEDLAERFSAQIPEKKFSPADIQGYLLVWRKKPREAVEGLKEWKEGKLRDMAAKQKVKKR